MADIFISYKSDERRIAEQLANDLRKNGFSVWYATNLLAGVESSRIIEKEIKNCGCFITLWSRRAIRSQWIRNEADLAVELGKHISARLDDVNIPLGFSHLPAVDLFDFGKSQNSGGFDLLIEAVRRKLSNVLLADGDAISGSGLLDGAQHSHIRGSGKPDDRGRFEPLPSAWRTRIFIAHASEDKPRIKPVVEVLIQQNFQIWIDKPQDLQLDHGLEKRIIGFRVRHDSDWPEQIRQAVKKSHAVLGCWSRHSLSTKKEQFQYEMYMGLTQGKLSQCRLDNITEAEIGYPWRFVQMANISNYIPGTFHSELNLLMNDFVNKPRLRFWNRMRFPIGLQKPL